MVVCKSAPRGFNVRLLTSYSAMIDGRTAFKIVNGYTIVIGFAVEEELKFWGKMGFPKKIGVMEKIKGMESEKIGMNVEFVEKRSMDGSIASTTQPQ